MTRYRRLILLAVMLVSVLLIVELTGLRSPVSSTMSSTETSITASRISRR